MKTFYCVVSSFDDCGKATASIVSTAQAHQKPDHEFHETGKRDIYIDWFDSEQAAQAYINNIRQA